MNTMQIAMVAALGAAAAAGITVAVRNDQREGPPSPRAGQQAQGQQAQAPRLVVYKSPSCGCCGNWVTYMRGQGFTVEVHDQDDLTEIKNAAGVTDNLASCHTAQVGGYTVEGHVPAEDIRRLLRERPQVAGIAAPGMPVGSPGMEQGSRRDRYQVLAFTRDGRTSLFATH